MKIPQERTFDCAKCPGFCCSYQVIGITRRDVQRLANHFGITFDEARTKFTKRDEDEEFVLRRKPDEHFGRICRFFDTEKRACTVYEARPSTCRKYPAELRCGYYDFLTFEREQQEDPEWIATTDNR